DAVLPCPQAHVVAVLRSNGDGTFFPSTSIATDGQPVSLVCADLDRDGDVDLAYTRAGDDGVTLMRRNGAGFERPVTRRTGGAARGLAEADLDGNGWSDMLCIKPPWEGVAALDGGAVLASADAYDLGAGHATSYAVADADGDGLPEIWTADDATGFVAVLTNRSLRTAVVVEEFVAEQAGDRTHLAWRFGRGVVGAFTTVTIERAPAAAGPWSPCSPALPATERMSFEVEGGMGGGWFRLALTGADGRRDWSAPIAAAPAGSATRIAAVREHGSRGAIDFSVAPAPAAPPPPVPVRRPAPPPR